MSYHTYIARKMTKILLLMAWRKCDLFVILIKVKPIEPNFKVKIEFSKSSTETFLSFSEQYICDMTSICIQKLLLMIRPIEWKRLHGHTTSKTFFVEGNITFPRFGQKRRQYISISSSTCLLFCRFWRKTLTSEASKKFSMHDTAMIWVFKTLP